MKSFTDQQLFEGLQTKNGTTVNSIVRFLYGECSQPISRMVSKNSGSSADAEDLVQEVLVAFLHNVWEDKFQLRSDAKVTTYIYGIAHTMWQKELGKRVSRDNRTDQFGLLQHRLPDAPNPEQELMNTEEVLSAKALFDKLCTDCQQLLTAFYRDKKSMKQIADMLGLGTEDNAKTRKYRCMVKLKSLMAP